MVQYIPLVAALGQYLVRALFQLMGRAVATTQRAPKLSRRQRQTMQNDQTRQADWLAYQQLMQLKDTATATATVTHKYRHVSLDFMCRHGLGVGTPTTTTAGTTPTDSASLVLESTFSRAPRMETDWMVQALRAPSKSSPAPRGATNSRHAQRTTAILQALHAASSPPSLPSPRSNSNVASCLWSCWSCRRLLGAYPGDTPPLDQAANPSGLESLRQ